MVFIYITCASEEEAKKIGGKLLEKGAAGCVNIFPIHSIYQDSGNIREAKECALIVKTVDSKVQATEDVIKELHSYEVPCVATFALFRMNREYKEWLTSQLV
ncbi:MAG: divalent-cation tolerance protein CutA [bacterium]|nr:divalent-cation tolerance protein CutA [bacterium]